jgi:hypothetical protein
VVLAGDRYVPYLTTQGLYTGFIYIAWRCYLSPGGFVHQWDMRVKDIPTFFKARPCLTLQPWLLTMSKEHQYCMHSLRRRSFASEALHLPRLDPRFLAITPITVNILLRLRRQHHHQRSLLRGLHPRRDLCLHTSFQDLEPPRKRYLHQHLRRQCRV